MNSPRLEPGDQQAHTLPSPARRPVSGGRGGEEHGSARVPRPEGRGYS